ncbi:hypothetical protein ACJX0J_009251, partial [Zea mays]
MQPTLVQMTFHLHKYRWQQKINYQGCTTYHHVRQMGKSIDNNGSKKQIREQCTIIVSTYPIAKIEAIILLGLLQINYNKLILKVYMNMMLLVATNNNTMCFYFRRCMCFFEHLGTWIKIWEIQTPQRANRENNTPFF